MRILAVPNWSFCDPELCALAAKLIAAKARVHYAAGDVDHQRTVTAFSGLSSDVFQVMNDLCRLILPNINLGAGGVHPFSGALDVAPFVLLRGEETELVRQVREWASHYSDVNSVPVHLYEKAALPQEEHRLPVLRGQLGQVTKPYNYGSTVHSRWGYSVVGVRNFLLAVNLNFFDEALPQVRQLAKSIRERRESGDPNFEGVRALAFHLKHQQLAQLSFNLTIPDRTSVDWIHTWVKDHLASACRTELIGVIRDVDLPKSTCLSPDPSQIVPTL